MKNLLLPISPSARMSGLIKYVGSLAQDVHAKIALVSTETAKQKVYAMSGTHIDSEASNTRLDEIHDHLTHIMHVATVIEPEDIEVDLYKKLGSMASRYEMMLVPLSLASNQLPKTLELTKIINESQVPLFLIPEDYKYRKIKCLIYAYDYKHEPEPPINKLNWLASWFGAEVRFISVFTKDSLTKERDKVNELHIQLLKSWKGGNKVSFDTIVYPQIPKFEEHYLGLPESGDLQVLSVSHQNFLDRLLHRGLMEGIQHSKYPYLIIHK